MRVEVDRLTPASGSRTPGAERLTATTDGLSPPGLLLPPLTGRTPHDRWIARACMRLAATASAGGCCGCSSARNTRDARRERRAEHDRLRLRWRAVRARVLRAVHPGAVRDGVRLPGDVHACRRGHSPRLWRAGAATLRKVWGWFGAGDLSLTNLVTLVAEFIAIRVGLSYFHLGSGMAVALGLALVLFTLSGGRYWRWERIVLGLALFNGLFLVAAILVKPHVGAIAARLTSARSRAAASTRCCCCWPRRSAPR